MVLLKNREKIDSLADAYTLAAFGQTPAANNSAAETLAEVYNEENESENESEQAKEKKA